MSANRLVTVLWLGALSACNGLTPPGLIVGDDDDDDGGGGNGNGACHAIYDPARFPTFEVEISSGELAALQDEFTNWQQREIDGLPLKPYHPVVFRYQGESYPDARMRLKGNPCCSWSGNKMQFVISFNEVNPEGRFRGLRKLALDAPPYDASLLHDRLAYSVLRDAGLPAACANSARLEINGELYGVYSNIEFLNKDFLKRNFPGKAGGTLYKYGFEPVTNEETYEAGRRDAFWAAADLAELDGLADLDRIVREWAGEAVLPHADGFWAGSGNFYLYDHPTRGFQFVPWDLDYSFELAPVGVDPFAYTVEWGSAPPMIEMVFADAGWRARFVDAVAAVRAEYGPQTLQARIDAWSAQIDTSLRADPNKPFSDEEHGAAVASLRAYVGDRAAFLDEWIAANR